MPYKGNIADMTSILFERTHAYLPEIPAYMSWLERYRPAIKTDDSSRLMGCNASDYDIVWRFMGLDRAGKGRFVVHEYNSLSTGTGAYCKNLVKRTLNRKPDRRVFLNENVRNGFAFHDDVPFRLRDMGVDCRFFRSGPVSAPIYDFVYAGSLNRGSVITRFLDHFAASARDMTLLLVGEAPSDMRARYQNAPNIVFKGRVPYEDVPALAGQARYGLNLMPDRYPFNLQTATKVVEYCALGLPVISTRYRWVEDYAIARQGRFFWLTPDFSNLSAAALAAFDFHTPDVQDLSWDKVIETSGVFDFL